MVEFLWAAGRARQLDTDAKTQEAYGFSFQPVFLQASALLGAAQGDHELTVCPLVPVRKPHHSELGATYPCVPPACALLSLHPLGSRTWHLLVYLRRISLALESTSKNIDFIERGQF